MVSTILEPPKLFLDTCHLIRLARLRNGGAVSADTKDAYALLDTCIRERHFGLIFNAFTVLEWVDGSATLESAREIAGVVDSASLQYEIEADQFVFLHEILTEIRRCHHGIKLPDFEVFFVRNANKSIVRAMSVLKAEVPSYFDDTPAVANSPILPYEIPCGTASEHVDVAWDFRRTKPDIYQQRVDGYKKAFQDQLRSFQQNKNGTPDYVGWMKRFLKIDRVLSDLNGELDVDQILESVDLTKCPAANLFLKARHKRIQAGNAPRENDVDDWQYLPAVPYADLVLSERNLRTFILQADKSLAEKVKHDPREARSILQKWL